MSIPDDSYFKRMMAKIDAMLKSNPSYNDAEKPFTIGDLVRLNSGGPILIIVDIDEKQAVVTDPMSGLEYSFYKQMLKRADKIDVIYDKDMLMAINYERYASNITPITLYRNYIRKIKRKKK